MWTVGLTAVKKKVRFQILPAHCGRGSSSTFFAFNYSIINDFIHLNETPVELFPIMIARLSTSWRKEFFWVVTKRDEDVSRFAVIDKDQRSKHLFKFTVISQPDCFSFMHETSIQFRNLNLSLCYFPYPGTTKNLAISCRRLEIAGCRDRMKASGWLIWSWKSWDWNKLIWVLSDVVYILYTDFML